MIRITDADELEGKVELIYHPLSELGLALDLLCSPGHHILHADWVKGVLESLSLKEKEQLSYFETLLDGYINLDLHINYFLPDYRDMALVDGLSDYIRDENNQISDLNKVDLQQMASFVGFMWDSYIRPVVYEHLHVIEMQIEDGNQLLARKGVFGFLEKVTERLSVSKNDTIKIEKYLDSEFSARSIDKFFIEAGIFAFPHLVVSDRHEEGFFFIGWDVPFRNDLQIAAGVNSISLSAFALSDKSRLRMMLMISECPMTQKELGRLMGFAKSTVSRHVNILIDAGFVLPEGSGRNVKLSLNKSRINEFSGEFTNWIS